MPCPAMLMRALSSTWRIAQRPDDSNREQHEHEHRDHRLGGQTVFGDPPDRQEREAEDERQRDGEHGDAAHRDGISLAKIGRAYPLAAAPRRTPVALVR